MKRIYLIFLLSLIACVAFAHKYNLVLGASVDFSGKQNLSSHYMSSSRDFETGGSVFAEFLANLNNQYSLGSGVEFQTLKSLTYTSLSNDEINTSAKFSHTPIYLTFLYKYPVNSDNNFIFNGHIGYAFFNGSKSYNADYPMNGGIYYAAGLGAILKHYQLRLMYKVYNGDINKEIDVKTFMLGLSIGIFM